MDGLVLSGVRQSDPDRLYARSADAGRDIGSAVRLD